MLTQFRGMTSVFLLSFVALFTLGCGDSHNDFVYTNGGPSLVNGSELVFRFERPVAAQTAVPASTASVRFDLYSSETPSNDALLMTEERLYADLIVLTNVSEQTRLVKVVLLDADGVPIGFYTAAVTVAPNSRLEVTLSETNFSPATMTALALTPDPLEFFVTLGDKATSRAQLTATATIDGAPYQVPFKNVSLTPEHSNVLEALEEGWVSVRSDFLFFANLYEVGTPEYAELFPNTSSVTATYTLNEVTKEAAVPVLIHRFYSMLGSINQQLEFLGYDAVPTPPGISESIYVPIYFGWDDDDDEGRLALYHGPDNEIVSLFREDLTYTLDSPSDKITFDPATGVLSVADDAPLGTVFTIEVTWVDDRPGGSEHTYVDSVNFKVSDEGFSFVPE